MKQRRAHFRLLLAEDNRTNATAIILNLEMHGHQVDWVKDGAACVTSYKQGGYDLILMDIVMPEMDGIEATHEIRKLERYRRRRIPIIGLTASVLLDNLERCISSGMDDVLAKQGDLAQLIQAIDLHITKNTID